MIKIISNFIYNKKKIGNRIKNFYQYDLINRDLTHYLPFNIL